MNCDKQLLTDKDDGSGFVYLVQPVFLKGTQRFKIGCSKTKTLGRLKNYLNDLRYICIFSVDSRFVVEKQIRDAFDLKFNVCAGREWYEGDETEITSLFLACLSSVMIDKQLSIENVKENTCAKNRFSDKDSDEDVCINVNTYADFLKFNKNITQIVMTSKNMGQNT